MSRRWWQRLVDALAVVAWRAYDGARWLPHRVRRVVVGALLRCEPVAARGPVVWRRWALHGLLAVVRWELRLARRELAQAEAEAGISR